MWTCPKCARTFTKTNQGHYCGNAPENVDEYIESQLPEARAHIEELRNTIRRCVPEISERIAWHMPRFEKGKLSVSFAACKGCISLYLDAETIEFIRPQFTGFTIKKNAVYLPYDRALPVQAIENAVKHCFDEK